MPNKKKKAKYSENVKGNKKPKNIENPDGYLDKKPVWVFSRCDLGTDKWNLCNCKDFYSTILNKLISFEGMTWSQIQSAAGARSSGTNHHHIQIHEMEKEARDRAAEIKLDVDELFSLRLDGKKRLFGIINDGVYHIIWYSENHDICLSHKKNT